jgi:hypothetical protein
METSCRSRLRQLRSESEGSAEAARGLSEVQVADKLATKERMAKPALPVGGAVPAWSYLAEGAEPPSDNAAKKQLKLAKKATRKAARKV